MSTDTNTLIQRLSNLLGGGAVISATESMASYLQDERKLYQGRAACVVLPASTEEVVTVVDNCRELGFAIVPQGGNTGYCGGASPDGERQVLVNLSRMNRVLEIDPLGHTVTVESGVILAELHAHAEKEGLLFPLSMGSEGSCQLGGVLSTNAGGLAVLQYGTAAELCLGLEVVLPSGEVLDNLTALRKDNTGYHLNSLFCGAEGTLGIITRAVLKLYPLNTAHATALLKLPDIASVAKCLALARRASGDRVTSYEYLSGASLALLQRELPDIASPINQAAEHQVLVELSAPLAADALRAPMTDFLEEAMRAGLVLDGWVAESESQRRDLWRIRENIPEAEKRAGRSIKHDISVAIGSIPEYMARAPALLQSICEHRSSIYGHVGDGNLHYNILAPEGADPEAFKQENGESFSSALHELATEMRGSFSAEHGIGKLKAAELQAHKNPVALASMQQIKHALDPGNLMNPGKLFRPNKMVQ